MRTKCPKNVKTRIIFEQNSKCRMELFWIMAEGLVEVRQLGERVRGENKEEKGVV